MRTEKITRTQGRQRVVMALQALGIVAVYFGIIVALMYPVAEAAGYLA